MDNEAAVTLLVRSGKGILRQSFNKETVHIGRSDKNDLVVNDTKASRYHCRIVCKDGTYVLEDRGSRNGTSLNGLQVLREVLSPGDRIVIGDEVIFFDREPGTDRTVAADRRDDREIIAQLMRERSNLLRLAEINKALNTEIDVHRLLEVIIDAVIELTNAERGFLITVNGGEMEFEVARNFMEAEVENPEVAVSRSIANQVMSEQRPVMSINAREDERFSSVQSIINLGLRSVLCVPLIVRAECVGAVYVDNRLNKGVFSDENRAVIETFADQAAIAVDNARRMHEQREKNTELERTKKELDRMNRGLVDTVRSQSSELKKARARLEGSGRAKGIRYHYGSIVGSSSTRTELVALLERIIDSDYPVLIQGESGTGKDLVASAIHFNSRRASQAYVSENCAALPETLLESELFGHEKGAFTGALSRRKGLLEIAHGGTLFLDEVGDMSPGMQTKLLRFLQDGAFRPVGGTRTVRVDVRIISASNRSLTDLVDAGQFRQDLFYRLNVLPVNIPPLRDRREDIPELVAHFGALLSGEVGREDLRIDPEVIDLFCKYHWPGNVRDLENELRRLVTLADDRVVGDLVSERIRRNPDTTFLLEEIKDLDLASKVEAIEKHEIADAMRLSDGNKSKAARRLGISRFTLQRKIDKYDLSWEQSE